MRIGLGRDDSRLGLLDQGPLRRQDRTSSERFAESLLERELLRGEIPFVEKLAAREFHLKRGFPEEGCEDSMARSGPCQRAAAV